MKWELQWVVLAVNFLGIVLIAWVVLTRTLRLHRIDMDRRIRSALADFLDYRRERDNDDDDRHLMVLDVNLPEHESLTHEARSKRQKARNWYIKSGRLRDRYAFIYSVKHISDEVLGREVEESYRVAEESMMAGMEIQRKAGQYFNYLGKQD